MFRVCPLHRHPDVRTAVLIKRDKARLDIFWLRNESVEDVASLPELDVLAEEITEELRAALQQFEEIGADLAVDPPAVSDIAFRYTCSKLSPNWCFIRTYCHYLFPVLFLVGH